MDEILPSHLVKLAEMLRPPEPEVLQGDELPVNEAYEITTTRGKLPSNDNSIKNPKNIEEYEEREAKEAEESGIVGSGLSDRKTPEYSMNYQQAVSAEDVFLQIGHKTPSSASCENLIVRVKMSGDKKENIDLAVDRQSITINSSQYYLKMPLPHGIDPDMSKANWDSADQTLVLTLKLDREFDFVNF